MEYITIGKEYDEGKVAKIKCIKLDNFKNISIKDTCFLLIVLTNGSLEFSCAGKSITATEPCFICFNELENPVLVSNCKAEYHSIYFHPDFLNVNMSFELLRSKRYDSIAQTHDMFLLKPFINNTYVVPICENFTERIENACEYMCEELTVQRDWYWSCRGRSYFMEIIIMLERMYGMMGYEVVCGGIDDSTSLENHNLRAAVLFIESHYMNDISLEDICTAASINHTTLTKLFREEKGMTVLQYLYSYRVKFSKKQLEFTNVPIKEIASRSGFKTVQHFSRTFKAHIGETPAAFRKNAVEKRKNEL